MRPDLKPLGSQTAPDGRLFPWNLNEGHSGFTTAQIDTNINTWYGAAPAAGATLWAGTNDISASVPAATTVSNLVSIINKILAIRPTAYVFIATVLNWTTAHPTENAAVVSINNLLGPAISSNFGGNPRVSLLTTPILADSELAFAGSHPTADAYSDKIAPMWAAGFSAAGF